MGVERNVYRVLMGKPDGKRTLERPRRRWEDGFRMDLRETGWGSVDWIYLARDRDRWLALVNLRVLAPRSWFVAYKYLRYVNVSLSFVDKLKNTTVWLSTRTVVSRRPFSYNLDLTL
jgi:hypothetical protein